jgi:ABC-type branched-subunit amino acid transport system ATPase component
VSLVCESFTAGYGKVRILWEVSFEVREGECVALLGKNGMGKTTLVKAMMGIADRFTGTLAICGQNVTSWPTHRIVRLGVSYVAQEEPIFGDLSVEDYLRLGGLGVRDYASARREVVGIFPRLGERTRQKAGTLSGGERKMLMLGRALLLRPKLVMLDEVSEGLQPSFRDLLIDKLTEYRLKTGASIFLVEQNVAFALAAADRFVVLSGGRIVETGDSHDQGAAARIERHMTL